MRSICPLKKESSFAFLVRVAVANQLCCERLLVWQIPSSGQIQIDGIDVEGPSAKCGFVFQNPALLPWLTVQKNVELGLRIQNKAINRKSIVEILKLVDLDEFENSKPRNLSGGMAQRAAIARALVNDQEILLMDEPFSALDEMTRFNMQNEILRIWKLQNITVLFITHDIDEAIRLATRIVVMTPRPGRIAKSYVLDGSFDRDPVSSAFMKLKKEIIDLFVEFDALEGIAV